MQIPERLVARGPIEPAIYVVSTPIGNLGDLTLRALRVLSSVEIVLAEDTRRARQLMTAYGLSPRLIAVHQHNEARLAPELVAQARDMPLALVSDAGTPLLSDPGLPLVREAIAQGVPIIPIPGASALLAATVVSGFAMDHLQFLGFLPHKGSGRRDRLERGERSGGAMVLYESANRMPVLIRDLVDQCGPDRQVAFCREMTKLHEQIWRGSVGEAQAWYDASSDHARGEYAVVVSAGERQGSEIDQMRVLKALAKALPPSKAAKVAAEITGGSRRELFELIEALHNDGKA
ncbi:16S rRNA (cytidine(1402)-2'-O)-methyltransferase [Litorivicinus lipolyticus]|uniref:16S rRNA (cytidine(1402)-2'-O)-methyltransferase n=1 Tax=Litorivicinus lipolyticus TaxID=418701 RepID=UPI003B5C2083